MRDDKGSVRLDGNSRMGQVSGYYFIDDYRLDNPYPGSVAGASIPGFDVLVDRTGATARVEREQGDRAQYCE